MSSSEGHPRQQPRAETTVAPAVRARPAKIHGHDMSVQPTTGSSWSIPAELEPVDAIHAAVLDDLAAFGQAVVRDPGMPLLDRDPQLPAGQVRSETAVRAGAERYM